MQPSLPGTARRKAALFAQVGPDRGHPRLGQDRQQRVDLGQVADDHDHQRFQEQPIGVVARPAALAWSWWRLRQPINQLKQQNQHRCLQYHQSTPVRWVWQFEARRNLGLTSVWSTSISQVDQDEGDRDHQHRRLDDAQVAGRDGLEDELAEARPGEDRLDQHRAAEQEADLEAGDGHDRWRGVLGDVGQDLPVAEPLGSEQSGRSLRRRCR